MSTHLEAKWSPDAVDRVPIRIAIIDRRTAAAEIKSVVLRSRFRSASISSSRSSNASLTVRPVSAVAVIYRSSPDKSESFKEALQIPGSTFSDQSNWSEIVNSAYLLSPIWVVSMSMTSGTATGQS